jgi:hypothetical protein
MRPLGSSWCDNRQREYTPVEVGRLPQPPAATLQRRGQPGERRRLTVGIEVGDEVREGVLQDFLGV